MTEQNQKKLYDHFVKTGQLKRAKEITDVLRYAKFKPVDEITEPKETKSKDKK